MEDLLQLLRQAIIGETSAWTLIVKGFKEQAFSPEEQIQIFLYIKQAAHESNHAIFLQALLYDKGYGVKKDAAMAFLLMREAAAKSHGRATYEVGKRFKVGKGITQNHENAFVWLQRAAGSPYYEVDAMYALGEMYEQGCGTKQDLAAAKLWYERAAKKGHQQAKAKMLQ